MQTNLDAVLFAITLDNTKQPPLYAQLTQRLRSLIQSGALLSGMRLPSSRSWAQELSVSRTTLTTALDQLTAEGYITARRGSGYFICEAKGLVYPELEHRCEHDTAVQSQNYADEAFAINRPEALEFPHHLWAKALSATWKANGQEVLRQDERFGWLPLRRAIAEHLRVWREIDVPAERILITSGAQESYRIIGLLLHRGSKLVVEDPGFDLQQRVFESLGLKVVRAPVNEQGLEIDEAVKENPTLISVTPSRHYPLGHVLSLERRTKLLGWSRDTGGWIVEDDYDSEFRYQGQPLPALIGQAPDAAIFYLGSFSKLFTPKLRLGYLVIPKTYLPQVHDQLRDWGTQASTIAQPALERLMSSGVFARHLVSVRCPRSDGGI